MNSEVVNTILAQYDSLTSLIDKLAETNCKEFEELKKQVNALGETLHLFLLGYIEEINQLNEQLRLQKVSSEDRIEELEKKLAELEAAIPKADFEYTEMLCQKEYPKGWNLLEKNTKTFLITARYLRRLIKLNSIDFSVVVIEYGKALEGEMHIKLYLPYLQYRTTRLPSVGGAFGAFVEKVIAGERKDIPFRTMFSALQPPARQTNDYYNDFQKYLRRNHWKCGILNNPTFYEAGVEYTQKYRNDAAHEGVISYETSKECNRKTKNLLNGLLSAYPKK